MELSKKQAEIVQGLLGVYIESESDLEQEPSEELKEHMLLFLQISRHYELPLWESATFVECERALQGKLITVEEMQDVLRSEGFSTSYQGVQEGYHIFGHNKNVRVKEHRGLLSVDVWDRLYSQWFPADTIVNKIVNRKVSYNKGE